MMIKFVQLSALTAMFVLCSGPLHAAIINEFTAVSLGDYTAASEVEGSVFVGGNVNGLITVGTNSPFIMAGDVALAVVGDINNGANNNSLGDIVVNSSSTVTGGINQSGPIRPVVVDPSLGAQLIAATGELMSTSSYLQGLTANSAAWFSNGDGGAQPGPVLFDVFSISTAANGVAVFDLPSGASTTNVQSISFGSTNGVNLDDLSMIVINVPGANIDFDVNVTGSAITSEAFKEKAIWNYYEATEVNLSRSAPGATLAPLATVTIGASTEGAVFAGSINQTNGEIHGPNFAPIIDPTAVPEPSSTFLLGVAVSVACAARFRRRLAC